MAASDLIIAITSCGPTPDSDIDERFGRAYWLMLYHQAADSWHALDNSSNRNAPNGAGRLAVQALVEHDVKVLLTGETGPKAFRLLREAQIEVFHGAGGNCRMTLEAWQEEKMKRAKSANDAGSPYCLMADNPLRLPIFNKPSRF